MSNVVKHPAAAIMTEVEAEHAVAETPEAQALQEAICKAISAYWDYLERRGLIYDDKRDLMRASALHITYDGWSGWEFVLKDGAIDRRYGKGEDPDPDYRGLNPTWPPKSPRS
jgi:hypothetical protein